MRQIRNSTRPPRLLAIPYRMVKLSISPSKTATTVFQVSSSAFESSFELLPLLTSYVHIYTCKFRSIYWQKCWIEHFQEFVGRICSCAEKCRFSQSQVPSFSQRSYAQMTYANTRRLYLFERSVNDITSIGASKVIILTCMINNSGVTFLTPKTWYERYRLLQ